MTTNLHPLRCETCKHYRPITTKSDKRQILCIAYSFKFGGFERFVDKLGCASHSDNTSDKVQQLLKAIDCECQGVEECVLRSDARSMAKSIRYYIQASGLRQQKEREG